MGWHYRGDGSPAVPTGQDRVNEIARLAHATCILGGSIVIVVQAGAIGGSQWAWLMAGAMIVLDSVLFRMDSRLDDL